MTKRVITYIIESIAILSLGLLVIIAFTGGFAFSVGPLTVNAPRLQNPLIILIGALLLRRILTGSFFRHPLFDRFARQFVEYQRVRKWVTTVLSGLIICLVISVVGYPLKRGLIGHYYDNPEWNGSPMMTVKDRIFNLWRMKNTYSAIRENYSIEWGGTIYIPVSGEYRFATMSDDGSEIFLDEQLVVDNRGVHGLQERIGSIFLEKGFHAIRVRYMQAGVAAEFQAYWTPPGKARELLSQAPLFTEVPSETAVFIGRFLETLRIVSVFLLIVGAVSVVLTGLSSRHILLPFLKTSLVGKAYRRCNSFLIEEKVEKYGFPDPPKKSWPVLLFAFIGYALLSLVWTYPLIARISTEMIGLGGDRYIYLWDMWWMKKALVDLHTNPLFTDYIFYPTGVGLTFHDFSIFNSFISIPLQTIFTLKEIYNILYLATYVLGGFGSFLLVRYLTGNALAAFLSGLVFAFWGGRTYYVDHLSLATMQWFPYCALYLIKTLRERSYRNPVIGALFLVMNALSAWYYALYMALFAAFFLLYFALREWKTFFARDVIQRFILMGLIFAVLMAPILSPMLQELMAGDDYMVSPVFAVDSASPNVLLFPNINHAVLGKYVRSLYIKANLPLQWGLSGGSFIGYTVLFLCLYTMFKLRHIKKGFWIVATGLFLLFAAGPYFVMFSKVYTNIPLPYLLLQKIPVLKIVRIPIRFMVLVMLGCSVLAGYASWDMFRKIRFKKTLFVLLAVLILFEFVRVFFVNPIEKTPEFYKKLGQDSEDYAILEITRLMAWEHSSVRAVLFQISHGKKLFHGHVSRLPFEKYYQAYHLYTMFDDLFTLPSEYLTSPPDQNLSLMVDRDTLVKILLFYNVRYVTLYSYYWYGDYPENLKRLKGIFGEPVGEENGIFLFEVTGTPPSETLVYPGFGIFPLDFQEEGLPVRRTTRKAEMKVLNVEAHKNLRIRFQAKSYLPRKEQLEILVNDTLITTTTIEDWTEVVIPSIAIQPGENTITLRLTDSTYETWKQGMFLRAIEVEWSS